jgi:lysophospholipase L1-like esterase
VTYIKLGYRGQTSYYLREKFDVRLCSQYKAGYENVLVLWTGTNDLALNITKVVPQAYANMVTIAQAAHTAGWKVVAITVISRGNYFISAVSQMQFPFWHAQLNQLILSSTAFDAVADPTPQLTNTSDTTLFWDACHLFPKGYQIVANLVAQAIRNIP